MEAALPRQATLVPKFDRRSIPAYSCLALMLCLGGILVFARGFTLSAFVFKMLPLACLLFYAAGLLRRIEWPKMATWLEATAVTYGHSIPAFMVLAPAASFALPPVDRHLAALDQAMGFDWVAYTFAMRPYLRLLDFAYFSFGWQPSLVIALLAAINPTRCWQYVTAGVACGLVTGIAFIFFPAYGAFIHYGITPEMYPPFTYNSSPWSWLPAFEKLRHGYTVFDTSVAVALVSFPSYHAATAVLTVWATWPVRYLRPLMIPLNIGLIAGCPIFGTHHFIDLIVGAGLACLTIYSIKRMKPFFPVPWTTE